MSCPTTEVRRPRADTVPAAVPLAGPGVDPAAQRPEDVPASRSALLVSLLLALLVGVSGCTSAGPDREAEAALGTENFYAGVSLPQPVLMPDATLFDGAGNAYNLRTTPSTPVTLLFFGYTHCPDVCVGVLSSLATALQRVPEAVRDHVTVVYVTTDPARDTEAVVRDYLRRFDPGFVGLTGNKATIRCVAETVGVDIQGIRELPDGGYEMGHSAQVIGFDRQHHGVVRWAPSTSAGALAHDIELLVARQQ